MVPPTEPCSSTRKDRPAERNPRAVASPAGPAPTTTTSVMSPARARLSGGSTWASRCETWMPCVTVLRMSPIPPSSPTMCTPARLDSKNSSIIGRSMPRSLVPKTSLMACTGHSAAHLPWPMQRSARSRSAEPATMPRTSPSGHAARQVRLPMHTSGSITGCSVRGMRTGRSASDSITAAAFSERRRLRTSCSTDRSAAASAAATTMRRPGSRAVSFNGTTYCLQRRKPVGPLNLSPRATYRQANLPSTIYTPYHLLLLDCSIAPPPSSIL